MRLTDQELKNVASHDPKWCSKGTLAALVEELLALRQVVILARPMARRACIGCHIAEECEAAWMRPGASGDCLTRAALEKALIELDRIYK
jgi:hypothetical protein